MPYLTNLHKQADCVNMRIKEKMVIGREVACDLQYSDALMSREHFVVIYNKGEGACHVKDNNSANGTFLNGIKLNVSDIIALSDGDMIKAGKQIFLFSINRPKKTSGICSDCKNTIRTYLTKKELLCPVCDGRIVLQ